MQATGGAQVTRLRAALLAVVVIGGDQATKAVVAAAVPQGTSRPLIGEWLRLSHIRNTGAAFGMLRGSGGLIALAAVVGVIVLVAIVVQRPPPATAIGASLIAGGACGNLADRIFRSGGVVDFVDFSFWPAFNVADSAITVGAVTILVAGWFEQRAQREGPEGGASGR